VPELFLKTEPGAILANDTLVNVVRGWPALTEKRVAGIHFVQEDLPDEIGKAIVDWMGSLADGVMQATMACRLKSSRFWCCISVDVAHRGELRGQPSPHPGRRAALFRTKRLLTGHCVRLDTAQSPLSTFRSSDAPNKARAILQLPRRAFRRNTIDTRQLSNYRRPALARTAI
jgi:hypothetical protein